MTRLGQHFLTSPRTAERIAESADIRPTDTILEIGPGRGILTEALLRRAGRVIAVEKDPNLAAQLRQKFAQSDTLVLIEADIRDVLKKPSKYGLVQHSMLNMKVVANIPYYLSGQLFRLLVSDTKTPPRLIVLMVQKEVAERVAIYRDPISIVKTNLLALSILPFMEARIAFRVSRGQFNPPPAVDSAVLVLKRRPHSLLKIHKISPKHYFALLRVAFSQKRKMALGVLKKTYRHPMSIGFNACSIPEKARAEDISPEQWLCLSKKPRLKFQYRGQPRNHPATIPINFHGRES